MRPLLGWLVVCAAVTSCTHGLRFTPSRSDDLSITRIIRFQGTELVDHHNMWNLKADVRNQYPGHTIFFISEVRCFKGDVEGQLDIEYFKNNTMHFKRGQTRKIAFRCQFPSPYENNEAYKVVVPRIFHNPLGDGETTDKVVATNVVWKIKPGHNL